jgi:hypothetical protein
MSWEEYRLWAEERAARQEAKKQEEAKANYMTAEAQLPEDEGDETPSQGSDVGRELEAQKAEMKAVLLQEYTKDPEKEKDDIYEELKRISGMEKNSEPELTDEERVARELMRIAQDMRKVHMQ